MNITEIRQKYPQYNEISDDELAKKLHAKYYASMPFEEFGTKIGLGIAPAKPATPAEPSSFMSRLGDVGLSAAQGVVGLGESAIGLADIPTFGLVGKLAAAEQKALFGGTSQDAQKYLESRKTPETKLAQQKVAEAEGFMPTAEALVENPSALVGTIAESTPSMFGGAGVGRLAMKAFPKLVGKPLTAAAIGEGSISAGSTAESVRQQQESGLLTPGQSAISAVSGFLTGALGIFGGKVANKFGVNDIDNILVGGLGDLGENATKKSIITSAVKGAIAESAFEELPQSMQEQISMNLATGKPWDEKVAEAGAQGAMAALVMGGGASGASQAITNANISRQQKRDELEANQGLAKPEKSMFEEQDEEDLAAQGSPEATEDVQETIKEEKKAADTSFDFKYQPEQTAQQPAAEVDDMIDPETGFPYFTGVRSKEAAQQEYNEANAQLDAAVKSGSEAEYEAALERVKKARADLGVVNRGEIGEQAPLFAQQQGLDLGAPTSERAQEIKPTTPTVGQQGLDFLQEAPTETYKAPTYEPRTFGMTTETSVEPLQKFLSQFKPRSTSEVEREKQQSALFGVRDENNQLKTSGLLDKIAELYEDATPEESAYYKGVIDSFFDQYAGVKKPSTDAALSNINNLSAEDQQRTLKDYTYLPDLTTYEGVKKLSDAFDDHVADAQLAGLGVTRSSSAYRQIDPIVRSLRAKPKASYDESEQAAYSYLDMFSLDNALRAAAFDIATNTPRNQLFRGQGKESAEKFNEWLLFNAPKKVQYLFDQYVKGYKKQNEGYQSFQALQDTAEAEAEYIESYAGPKRADKQISKGALHPAIVAHIRNNNLQSALTLLARTSKLPFQRELANKLAELELNTTIGIDAVEGMANDYVQTTGDLVGKFAQGAALYFPEYQNVEQSILDVWNNAETNFQKFSHLEDLVNRFNVRVKERNLDIGATQDVVKDLKQKLVDVTSSFTADGVYFPLSNSISLNSKNPGAMSPYTLLHETMHAATARIVASPMFYSSKQQEAVKELKKLYEFAQKNAKGMDYYGLTNVDEFIAEAFTSKSFQEFLKGIPYKYANASLFDKFVEFCLKIFGYNNVLASTIANVNVLFDAPTENTFRDAPPAFAKRNKSMFEGNSAERSKPFTVLNDLIKNNEKWDDVKDKMAAALSTMNTQTRKHWLGAFTLRQMEEMIGTVYGRNIETGEMGYQSKIPQISKFLRSIEDMTSERAKVIQEATNISKELMNLQRENQAAVDALTAIVQTSTVNEVDPTKPAPQPKDPNNVTKEEKDRIEYHRLVKQEWDKLGKMKNGKEAQDMYVKMREFFKTRLNEFKTIAYEREFNRLLNDAKLDESAAEYQDQVDAIKTTARSNIDDKFSDSIDPYFPLKRFGDFWVRYGTGKNRKYMQFEDAVAKNKFLAKARADYANKLRKQGYTPEQIAKEVKNPTMINHGNQLPSLADDMFSDRAVYEEVKDIVASTGGTTVTDPEELRKLVLEQLGELYITTLPLQSVQRMFLHRQNIAGASTDLIRSFQHSGFHMAYQHARFKHAPKMDDQLAAAKSMVDSLDDADEKAVLSDYITEITNKYRENVIKPPPSNWLANKLSNVNFLWYLTAPASAMVNMMAVPSIALPVLGGKFGTKKSWKTITKYMTMLSGSGWKNPQTGEFDAPSIGRSPKLTALQKRAYEAFSENLLEQSLAHDAAALAENPSLDYTGRWGKIMQIATFPFHKAERFNREITAMAAFELAYEKNGGDFDAAVKEASDLTWKTMFDYATYNKPRYMQGNLAKVLLAFKQYAQHMTYLLMRTAYEATEGVSKAEFDELTSLYGEEAATKYVQDTNELRSQARKTFMLMMGMSFLFAGAAGLPIWWMYTGMAKAFHAVFGNDEEPYDVENDFKNSMNNVFGGFVGDSISRGLVPQLTGASLSDRMSTNLTDMWFRDVKKNQDEVGYVQNMLINLLGPTAGLMINGAEAVKRFNDGNTERAFEAIAPGAFKNLLAGSRLAKEGALTMKGDTLLEDVSGYEAFLQMLGFTPERLAQRQAANIEAKSAEQAVMQRRQDLLNYLAMAIEREDEEGEDKVLAKIEEFNDANDWAVIKASTIRSSLRKRAKARAMSGELGGLTVNKKFADQAEAMTSYAEEEEE